MSLAEADLPSDPAARRAFALACQAELLAANSELKAAQTAAGEAEDISKAKAEDRRVVAREGRAKRKPLGVVRRPLSHPDPRHEIAKRDGYRLPASFVSLYERPKDLARIYGKRLTRVKAARARKTCSCQFRTAYVFKLTR